MIVVLDTNVIISALLSPKGNSAEIIRLWETEIFDVAFSPALIAELNRVLTYPHISRFLNLSPKELDTFLYYFQSMTTHVDPPQNLAVIENDPADNQVLECALASNAAFIITGDQHLLKLKEYQGIVILTPSAFLAVL